MVRIVLNTPTIHTKTSANGTANYNIINLQVYIKRTLRYRLANIPVILTFY